MVVHNVITRMMRRTTPEHRGPQGRTINVLCCSGLDPTGGAGIQADIEAVAAQGAHALAIITALTAQDTRNVATVVATDTALLQQQLELLLVDCEVAAIKLGLLGDVSQLPLLAACIQRLGKPVVIDPILRAGGGRDLVSQTFATAFGQVLFPLCTVLTPNAAEARRWTGHSALDEAGAALLAMGPQHVVITGGDEPGRVVSNRWYHGQSVRVFERERIEGQFHGAGCTLAATIAARLALGEAVEQALLNAQEYVAESLRQAKAVGRGRLVPHRAEFGAV